MIQVLYNLLLAVLAPLALPYWVLRGRAKGHPWSSLPEALGLPRFQHDATARNSIWFHAVSVGEVLASLPFLRQLRRELPSVPLYVSTGTPSGRQLAEEKLRGIADAVFRAPVELPCCIAKVFSRLRPRVLIVTETELWPNYFFQAKRFGAAVLLVNGRISDRSAPQYKAFRFLFGPVLKCADLVLAQSPVDRERFLAAGSLQAATRLGGNLKYDFDSPASEGELSADLRQFLECTAPDLLIVAGSTREGEERMLTPALRAVATQQHRVLFVDAPRHPTRFDEAERALAGSGLPVVRRSRLDASLPCRLPAILVLDSLGELATLYPRADFAFVGGSLNGWGGHNVLEPVLHGRPVVVGPTMQNFRQITADLLRVGGLIQVGNAAELPSVFADLAADTARREAVGQAGQSWARAQQGASARASAEAIRLYRSALPRRPPSIRALLALRLPSAIWGAIARLRRSLYGSGLLSSNRLSTPVVSVGNLTVGGTGKTPVVAWLVERLASAGHAAAVLTRGYGRSAAGLTHMLRAGEEADPRIVGDEPAILARRFAASAPRTLVAVGADRCANGRLVEKGGGIDFLVLDDGFQHMQLERSLNVVLLDGSQPFGNGYLLPLGRLREPPSSLKGADIVLVTRVDPELDYSRLHAAVREWNPHAPILHAETAVRGLVDLRSDTADTLDALAGKRVAAFCGIGNPLAFWMQTRKLGCEIVLRRAYRDHHRYTPRDLAHLRRAAGAAEAEAFLTTVKDSMNLGAALELELPAYALQIDLEIDRPEELLARVLSLKANGPAPLIA